MAVPRSDNRFRCHNPFPSNLDCDRVVAITVTNFFGKAEGSHLHIAGADLCFLPAINSLTLAWETSFGGEMRRQRIENVCVFCFAALMTVIASSPQFTMPATRSLFTALFSRDFSQTWIANLVWPPIAGFFVSYLGNQTGFINSLHGFFGLWGIFGAPLVTGYCVMKLVRCVRDPECPLKKKRFSLLISL